MIIHGSIEAAQTLNVDSTTAESEKDNIPQKMLSVPIDDCFTRRWAAQHTRQHGAILASVPLVEIAQTAYLDPFCDPIWRPQLVRTCGNEISLSPSASSSRSREIAQCSYFVPLIETALYYSAQDSLSYRSLAPFPR